jgi:ribonuclease HI
MADEIVFHVAKPIEKQLKQLNIVVETTREGWAFRYKKNDELTELRGKYKPSLDLDGYEREYLTNVIKAISHVGSTKRPIVVYVDNPYLKTLIVEWILKWEKTDFKFDRVNPESGHEETANRPNRDLLVKISDMSKDNKIDVVLEHKISDKVK